jgi:cytochrome b pre-mRNA-processing protein 3
VLTWLRSRSSSGKTAAGLYGSIVTQARIPAFYADARVPDNMEGRFGMIGVHMFLVLERIRTEGDKGSEFARALLETMMTDLDDSMREIGIGDMGVPRRVKKAAAALHEQLDAYRAAADQTGPGALEEALSRYVYRDAGAADGTGKPALIAAYMHNATAHLAKLPWASISAGSVTFPTFDS